MTERLYYQDSHLWEFTARVRSCRPEKDRYAVVLDRTAFFPEGGGQAGDRGLLGGVRVLDTKEQDGEAVHFCDGPLTEGETVAGEVDAALRFRRMQIHSGEHIVSGIAHTAWGCENVGFHMTDTEATVDVDRELTAEQLTELERRANEAVWADRPVRAFFPTAEELETLVFRQKKAIEGEVRLVEFPGADICACCAPHVKSTGEIGLIRISDAMRHRGGMRFVVTAGAGAWESTAAMAESAHALSRLFSAPRDKLVPAAERLLAELESARAALADMERRYTAALLDAAPAGAENLCFFLPEGMSSAALRELAETGKERCTGMCAVFAGEGESWRYAIGSARVDLRQKSRDINAALHGRGGGAPGLIQGGARAARREIEAYFPGRSIG